MSKAISVASRRPMSEMSIELFECQVHMYIHAQTTKFVQHSCSSVCVTLMLIKNYFSIPLYLHASAILLRHTLCDHYNLARTCIVATNLILNWQTGEVNRHQKHDINVTLMWVTHAFLCISEMI